MYITSLTTNIKCRLRPFLLQGSLAARIPKDAGFEPVLEQLYRVLA